MPTVPVIPDTAPFTLEQRAWLNGYLAGLFSGGPVQDLPQRSALNSHSAPTALTPLTILFGSQTGTAESLAKRAAKEAGRRGFAATVIDVAGFTPAQLAQEKAVLLITSTYGEGEPPDNAKALHAALGEAASSAGVPPATNDGQAGTPMLLSNLRFSVCALGDTNYVQFCQCGKDFDTRLEKLGATRVAPRADCDLDYEEKFEAWLGGALAALGETGRVAADAPVGAEASAVAGDSAPRVKDNPPCLETGYSRKNPFPALVLASRNLNGIGSAKSVHHIELDLGDSGLSYEVGDALGVFAQNNPELVGDVLAALGCDGEEAVPAPDGSTLSLRRALTEHYDLGKPAAELLAAMFASATVGRASDPPYSEPHHVLDCLLGRPDLKLSAPDFVRALRKLQPRLYSISSSPKAHAGRVHLTVGTVRYEHAGRRREGVCSTFLADRVAAGETRAGIFVHTNKAFRLPANSDTPMIMAGPGTGIAPFRAFLHERRATGAKGKNWLFFGDQRAATDFLYRDEIEELRREGLLTRLDTAFSRDQAEKIYVQHRMLEHAAELFAWLEAGAHFYVCGDASRMAKDVDAALHRVVELGGKKSPESAAAYIAALRAARRYARDVY
ncbi:MAG TPA: sulfite reductase subunit alpha [Opitutus sp.]|nr:sulfite reductase subunit alpha [Opitutus sp.]